MRAAGGKGVESHQGPFSPRSLLVASCHPLSHRRRRCWKPCEDAVGHCPLASFTTEIGSCQVSSEFTLRPWVSGTPVCRGGLCANPLWIIHCQGPFLCIPLFFLHYLHCSVAKNKRGNSVPGLAPLPRAVHVCQRRLLVSEAESVSEFPSHLGFGKSEGVLERTLLKRSGMASVGRRFQEERDACTMRGASWRLCQPDSVGL